MAHAAHPACAHAELRLARMAAACGDLAEARARHAGAAPVLSAAMVPDAPTLRLSKTLAQRLQRSELPLAIAWSMFQREDIGRTS